MEEQGVSSTTDKEESLRQLVAPLYCFHKVCLDVQWTECHIIYIFNIVEFML